MTEYDYFGQDFADICALSGADNPDVGGFFKGKDGLWRFDRRRTLEAMGRLGLTPRNADLDLMGPAIVEVSTWVVDRLGLEEK